VTLAAVILAVDPGAKGGWCVLTPERCVAGPASTARERQCAVAGAAGEAEFLSLPLVVVMERWTAGGKWGAATMMGLGAQAGRWSEAVETYAPAARVVRVYAQTWRAGVLRGLPWRSREQAARSAGLVAAKRLGRACGPDEGVAACIAIWAEASAEVARVAGMRAKRKRPAQSIAMRKRAALAAKAGLLESGAMVGTVKPRAKRKRKAAV
jgi:hypothetical protein